MGGRIGISVGAGVGSGVELAACPSPSAPADGESSTVPPLVVENAILGSGESLDGVGFDRQN